MKAAAGAPEEEISLDDKVWTLLVDFATTDRSEKKALRRIRDEIIQTVALDCDKRRLALIDADSKAQAERDKRLADMAKQIRIDLEAYERRMNIGYGPLRLGVTVQARKLEAELSNTQTEPEESKLNE